MGNSTAGKALSEEKCARRHAAAGDLAGIAKKYSAAALKAAFLKPKIMDEASPSKIDQLHDEKTQTGRLQHRSSP